ncbi:hypothetical protein DID78_00995 [Candidatus Marinamargulisbacteria bacterium SCGC AG-343-D04]|nr:hypothetical protein DID78_00995 [Candidatus Marinamargulisbacteria bacterium SCGC AG-343-D04]
MLLFHQKTQTKKGLKAIKEHIKQHFIALEKEAKHNALQIEKQVYIGTAGHFSSDYILTKNSAPNLCDFSDEFDNINIYQEFKDCFPDDIELHIVNDAIAQACSGLYELNQLTPLTPSTILYIGPGTGLGGGLCRWESPTKIDFFTDGHICDVIIPDRHGNEVEAESILSSHFFKKEFQLSGKEIAESPTLLEQYSDILNYMGDYAFRIIECIKTKKVKKGKFRWSKKDCNQASKIDTIVYGGSIGRSDIFMPFLQQRVDSLCKNKGINIKSFRLPENNFTQIAGAYLHYTFGR